MSRRRYKKKFKYDEYYINGSKLEKYYNMYLDKPLFDKILDVLIVVAIVVTISSIITNYFRGVNITLLILLNSFAGVIIFIFAIELVKKYVKSKSWREFFRKHWFDFILVTFLSIYFLFISFIGFIRLFILDWLKPFFQQLKDIRVVSRIFGKG